MNFKEIIKPKNIFIGILILMNVIAISLLVNKNHKLDKQPKQEQKAKNRNRFIIDKIGFDSIQAKEFKAMKEKHLEEVSQYRGELNELRKEMFSHLNNDTFNIDSYSQKMSLIQSKLDKMAFIHFKEMRSICRPDQLESFDKVMQKIMSRMPRNYNKDRKKKNKY